MAFSYTTLSVDQRSTLRSLGTASDLLMWRRSLYVFRDRVGQA